MRQEKSPTLTRGLFDAPGNAGWRETIHGGLDYRVLEGFWLRWYSKSALRLRIPRPVRSPYADLLDLTFDEQVGDLDRDL